MACWFRAGRLSHNALHYPDSIRTWLLSVTDNVRAHTHAHFRAPMPALVRGRAMSASAEEVLNRLSTKIPFPVTDTNKAAAAIDRQRARKQDEKKPSSRKPELGPLRGADRQDLVSTPWDMLGVFARATTLARQGRGRGLAEHRQGLKYCQAMTSRIVTAA